MGRFADIPANLPGVLDCAGDGVADAMLECGGADSRRCRRPAGGVDRAGLFRRWHDEEHVRHGCFLVTNTGEQLIRSANGLPVHREATASAAGRRIRRRSAAFSFAGAAVRWLRDSLRIVDSAAETEAAARRMQASKRAACTSCRSISRDSAPPYWRPDVRGLVCGLSLDTSRDDVIAPRNGTAGVAYQSAGSRWRRGRPDGAAVTRLRVDGGMVANDGWLCRCLADIAGVRVERPVITETTAFGAGD